MKMPTRKQTTQFLSGLAEKGAVLAIILYIAVSVGRSVYKNYQINQRIDTLQEQIDTLEQEKAYLRNLIAYYKTSTFKELKAREELGLQKPGENVLAVPVDPEDVPVNASRQFAQEENKEERILQNYEKWYAYYFE